MNGHTHEFEPTFGFLSLSLLRKKFYGRGSMCLVNRKENFFSATFVFLLFNTFMSGFNL